MIDGEWVEWIMLTTENTFETCLQNHNWRTNENTVRSSNENNDECFSLNPTNSHARTIEDAGDGGNDRCRLLLLVEFEALVVDAAIEVDGERRNLEERVIDANLRRRQIAIRSQEEWAN